MLPAYTQNVIANSRKAVSIVPLCRAGPRPRLAALTAAAGASGALPGRPSHDAAAPTSTDPTTPPFTPAFTSADLNFMSAALAEAAAGAAAGEVPVGAVLVHQGRILARAHNRVDSLSSPLAHAEMLCLASASSKLRAWRLLGATLYVTVEPCPMCAGALMQARVSRVVYGTRQPRLGADGSWVQLFPRRDPGAVAGAGQEQQQRQGQGRKGRQQQRQVQEGEQQQGLEGAEGAGGLAALSVSIVVGVDEGQAAAEAGPRAQEPLHEYGACCNHGDAQASSNEEDSPRRDMLKDRSAADEDFSLSFSGQPDAEGGPTAEIGMAPYEDNPDSRGMRSVNLGARISNAVVVPSGVKDRERTVARGVSAGGGVDAQAAPPPLQPQRPHPFHDSIEVQGGCMAEECAELMRAFFRRRRQEKRQEQQQQEQEQQQRAGVGAAGQQVKGSTLS